MRRIATGPRGRPFALTDAMIARRDGIARGLGYVLRPCSYGPPPNGRPHQECWEKPGLTAEWGGRTVSIYHVRRASAYPDGRVSYSWPDDVELAAWAIDKGKPLATDPPAEVQGEMFAETRP